MPKKQSTSAKQPKAKQERLISDKRIQSLIKVISRLHKEESSFQVRIKSNDEKKAALETAGGTFIQAYLALNRSTFTALSLELQKLQRKIAAKNETLTKYVEVNNRINGSRLGSAS